MSDLAVAPRSAQAEEPSWKLVPLGDLCRTTSGGTPSRRRPDYFQGQVPWVKSGELTDGLVSKVEEFITEEALANSSAKVFPAGTLLIALYGATVGKLGVLTRDAATNQAVCAIFPPKELDTRFLYWYLLHRRADLVARAVGGAQPNISQGILRSLDVPVPPIAQQREIVAELEKQFSRLDEAVANLKRAKASLARYRAQVLSAAIEGRLSIADEGATSKAACESASELLDRVLQLRRVAWDGRGRYRAPASPQPVEDAAMPAGWAVCTLEQLAWVDVGFAFRSAEFAAEGIRLLRGENIEPGSLRWEDVRYWPPSKLAGFEHLLLEVGQIVLAMDRPIISSGLKLARVKATDLPCLLVQRMTRLRCVDRSVEPYLNIAMSTERFKRHLLGGQTGTQLPHVSGTTIALFVVPLPPPDEQRRIVAEVERRLSIVREVEAEVDANLQRAQSLRQATLHAAFGGAVRAESFKRALLATLPR